MKHDVIMRKINHAGRMADEFLKRFIKQEEQIPNLHEGMLYALGLDTEDLSIRGKRLRPALGLLVCKALGGNPNAMLPFAAAIELFHNFTLVHDDIEDGDTYRRNRPCVYIKYKLPSGINIGDYMLVKVFRALLDFENLNLSPQIRLKLIDLMTDTMEHTHIGQALDINARENKNFTTRDYFRLVTEKTGYCLAAPMAAAAIVTKSPSSITHALTQYAKAIGPLFQIRDDMIDLTEGKGRKSIGSDVREGKRSFLVAHVTGHCTEKEHDRLYSILDAQRGKTTDSQVLWIKDLFQKYGSFDAAREANEILYEEALNAIAKTPRRLKDLLEAFAELLVKRKT